MKNWGYDKAGNSGIAVTNYKQTAFRTDSTWFFIKVQGRSLQVKNKTFFIMAWQILIGQASSLLRLHDNTQKHHTR